MAGMMVAEVIPHNVRTIMTLIDDHISPVALAQARPVTKAGPITKAGPVTDPRPVTDSRPFA